MACSGQRLPWTGPLILGSLPVVDLPWWSAILVRSEVQGCGSRAVLGRAKRSRLKDLAEGLMIGLGLQSNRSRPRVFATIAFR